MTVIGLGVGFVLGAVVLISYVLITTSGWYHVRYHSDPPSIHDVIGGCGRCTSLWRRPTPPPSPEREEKETQ